MSNTASARSDYITQVRQAAANWLAANDALNALKATWDAGMNAWLTDADFTGNNAGLDKAAIAAVVGTTLTAENTLLSEGHRTNLETVRP